MSKIQEIEKRWSEATPGTWRWRIDRGGHGGAFLQSDAKGKLLILDAVRNGMNGATMRFRNHEHCLMFKAHERESHLDENPDAQAIANAPTDVAWLVAEVKRLTEENEALKNSDHYQLGYSRGHADGFKVGVAAAVRGAAQ